MRELEVSLGVYKKDRAKRLLILWGVGRLVIRSCRDEHGKY
jgi:hypothetical protein